MKLNSQAMRQPTLLLVEDDELVRDAMTRLFVREGYLVLTAATGHDAIGLLRTPGTSVDVVLLDIGLPDVSGADLCKRLREFLPKLPVVVCTGAAGPEEADDLRRLGVARYLCKPIEVAHLVAALRDAIADGLLPGPRILTSMEPLLGRGEATGTPDDIRAYVRKQKAAGADLIKVFASGGMLQGTMTLSPEQLQAACDEAKKQGLRTLVHAMRDAVPAVARAG